MSDLNYHLMFLLFGAVIGFFLSFGVKKEILRITTEEGEKVITISKGKQVLITVINIAAYVILSFVYDMSLKGSLMCLCTSLLVMVIFIDWNTFEIPEKINAGIFILGLIRLGLDYKNWSLYIIGFFAVSIILFILFQVSNGAWIGGGDVKLMAAAGLFLGWKLILVAFVVGCVLGSVIHLTIMAISKGERMLAFGPYLSLGIFLSMIWGEQLAGWYLSLFNI